MATGCNDYHARRNPDCLPRRGSHRKRKLHRPGWHAVKLREPKPIPPCPTAGEGVHSWLISAAWACRFNDMSIDQTARELASRMTRRPSPANEIEMTVAKVFACAEPATTFFSRPRTVKPTYRQPLPSSPRHGNEALRGYPPAVRKWSPRCSTCEGRGWIRSIKGEVRDCPRCSEGSP